MNPWLVFSLILLVIWLAMYVLAPTHRNRMIRVSLATAPFGLTEPLFVPEYWSPPSLFDLAEKTGFDIESLIFCFAIGGIGSAIYLVVVPSVQCHVAEQNRHVGRHRWHRLALMAPAIVFLPVWVWTNWNPIYPAILGLFAGGVATALCRPRLFLNIWVGGSIFAVLYFLTFLALNFSYPDFLHATWNMAALTGMHIGGVPIEEILFAFAFGTMWSGVYEHLFWVRTDRADK